MKEIKLEVSKLTASCLQRMIYNEIEFQKRLIEEEREAGWNHLETRDLIIKEMNELAEDLEKQNINKYFQC